MKDEIKEILDKLNSGFWEKDEEEITYKILFSNEVYQLLDYITNLQEENKKLKENLSKGITNNLENKYLNNKLYKELQDYKTRNEKAIEYIKEKSEEVELNFYGFPDKITSFKGSVSVLLNILQGEQNE